MVNVMLDSSFEKAPRLEALSPHLTVSFWPKKFRSASVCWINDSWFLAHGLDVLENGCRQQVKDWLIEEFAYGVPRPERDQEPAEFYVDQVRELRADRYGAPGGTPNHGGSGRCGIAGALNAKGIGPTPLVSEHAAWYHSHGCVWLEEALREAILSEVAYAEFPFGAIPVVAVICIHDVHRRKDGSAEPTRGIIVRPNFIRPAHFERSILFGDGGHENSPQYLDSVRTKDSVQAFCRHSTGQTSLNVATRSLRETLGRIATQVGFGWAHRLFHGGYFSSNITIDGELVDFGSFRAVPNWHRAFTVRNAAPFGNELDALRPMIASLAFHFAKYGDPGNQIESLEGAQRYLNGAAEAAFDRACLEALVTDDSSIYTDQTQDQILEVLRRYFRLQQLHTVDYFANEQRRRAQWLFPTMSGAPAPSSLGDSAEATAAATLRSLFTNQRGNRSSETAGGLIQLAAASRWLRPRPLLYRENLSRVIERMLRLVATNRTDFETAVGVLATSVTARSRRHFPGFPPNLLLRAYVSAGHCSAMYCLDPRLNRHLFRFEATRCGDAIRLFGRKLSLESLTEYRVANNVRASLVTLQVPTRSWNFHDSAVVEVAGVSIFIPVPDMVF